MVTGTARYYAIEPGIDSCPRVNRHLKALPDSTIARQRDYRSISRIGAPDSQGPMRWATTSRRSPSRVRVSERLASAKAGDVLPFKRLCRSLGITSHDFKRNIRQHTEFIETIAELGVVEWGRGMYHTGFAAVA